MGTSTNYKASPNWSDTKQQVTQTGGDGFVTPQKAASLVSAVVSQMTRESSLGFKGSSGGGAGSTGGGTGGGGSTRASGGSIRNVARGVGSFLSDVQQKGFEQALVDRGLSDLSDKSPDEVALEIVDILCEPTSLIDDTVLRDALIDMMMDWSEGKDSLEDLGANIESASSNIGGVLHELMGHYIYHVFKSVGYQGVLKTHGFEAAESMCGQIRDYIEARVSSIESTRDLASVDWSGLDGSNVVDEIVADTVDLFGGTE
ncbi:MAG TPA: hypothetical protein DCX06_00955 [Opitutae bacterium]|nr:hypothetical protein [Opitutae bacterium]